MIPWKRATLLGLLSWLAPFLISLLAFPLKRTNAPLFETLMTVVTLMTAALLLPRCFRDRVAPVHAAVLVGAAWMAINLVLDYPMFAFGPMKMDASKYYSEIGLDYLIFPVFAFGAARLAGSVARA
ncbi:MAG: hypothetical protein LAQ69_14010 [Acidobacteriia bacterium]|nr:hypothetical protein [Terriglobia bacterium]